MDSLTLRRPDDWHLHLRDAAMLDAVLPPTAAVFGRAVVMPNLKPPVTTTEQAAAYRERILASLPEGSRFTPLMTAYLTDRTDPDDLAAGHAAGVLTAVKLYPAGATTNSDAGVTSLTRLERVLERLADIGMPLLVHGEVTDHDVDIFDREARFLDEVLEPIVAKFPTLRVVVEHATTAEAVQFVRAHGERVGCTITPQHLLANRNDLLVGGIRPHFYCLPVLKRRKHQVALLEAATSGEAGFFLGTDSAPHPKHAKESDCGCAGCYSAPAALPLYAEAFERAGALEHLETFASLNGPAFYGLPVNEDTVTLVRKSWEVPESVAVDGPASEIVPFWAGQSLRWRVA
ncbi:MAG: dihydroorotase [Deltaproteobacteria bacterium]|nr:MAG: dihydroorotase [Deltaproteobacteria bacterium]